ncbi:MAG TPA: helix-turn-helix transcriptional regulator [Planctomycetaceae bacterium]|nr:helix-turn-helix transcriptional regulator [Planctomycetaceae bacterium]
MPDQQTHNLSAEDKARYAQLARHIEAEFPPGEAQPHPPDGSLPPALGEYFDLKAVLSDLRRIRESDGLTLADLRERTGLDLQTLEHIESAENPNPSVNALAHYARALGRRIALTLEQPGSCSRCL